MEQFEKYKALEEEKIKEENITLNSSREQFDKERENALEKIETGKKELETEKEQFARYKEVEENLKDAASPLKMEWLYINRITLAIVTCFASIFLF